MPESDALSVCSEVSDLKNQVRSGRHCSDLLIWTRRSRPGLCLRSNAQGQKASHTQGLGGEEAGGGGGETRDREEGRTVSEDTEEGHAGVVVY